MQMIQHQAARHAEAFPAASFLLPARARGPLRSAYDFLRGADDLADDPALSAPERLASLRHLKQSLTAGDISELPLWAQGFAPLYRSDDLYRSAADALLQAFMQDTMQTRYATYDDLLEYCRLSAVPVGRMVLYACGEAPSKDWKAADSLCIALQLLNHVRDVRHDHLALDRIYLPQDWMAQEGTEKDACSRLLREIELLLKEAAPLPKQIQSRRLRMEMRWCLAAAHHWHGQLLRRQDLRLRPRPSKLRMLLLLARSLCR